MFFSLWFCCCCFCCAVAMTDDSCSTVYALVRWTRSSIDLFFCWSYSCLSRIIVSLISLLFFTFSSYFCKSESIRFYSADACLIWCSFTRSWFFFILSIPALISASLLALTSANLWSLISVSFFLLSSVSFCFLRIWNSCFFWNYSIASIFSLCELWTSSTRFFRFAAFVLRTFSSLSLDLFSLTLRLSSLSIFQVARDF